MPRIAIIDHSIDYRVALPRGSGIPDTVLRLAYAAVVLGALWLSSDTSSGSSAPSWPARCC